MGAVDRGKMMSLFEMVHEHDLLHAYNALRCMPDYHCWRIALRERLLPITEDVIALNEIQWIIEVKLVRHGEYLRLEVDNDASQKAIEAWEERNKDAIPWHFECPMTAIMEDRRGTDRHQAGAPDVR